MLKPLGPRVIIKADKVVEEKVLDERELAAKRAGIVFLEKSEQDLKREQQAVVIGTVVAIGSTAFHEPVGDGTPWVKIGDRVYYAKFAGKDIEDPETKEKFLLLNDEDLNCLVGGE